MSTVKNYTLLKVTNQESSPVVVYVTFAAQNPSNECCPSPVGVSNFPFLTQVDGNSLMGYFTLDAQSSQILDSDGQCLSGNICFYIMPQCPVEGADFNNGEFGTSIAEFTLNPNENCAEAFDISCVNGVNSFIVMKTDPNSGWQYGPNNTPLSTVNNEIYNRGLQDNTGLPGVYPVNCTDCIQLVGTKPCPTLPIGPPQNERICNIQRNSTDGVFGGMLEVILTQPIPAV